MSCFTDVLQELAALSEKADNLTATAEDGKEQRDRIIKGTERGYFSPEAKKVLLSILDFIFDKYPDKWAVFKDAETGEELLSYTVYGTFEGEAQATIEQLAYERGISPDRIKIVYEYR